MMTPSPRLDTRQLDAPNLLEVQNLAVHIPVRRGVFGRHGSLKVRAVDGVDLQIRRGGTLGLVGESGCGKSTTGRAIMRLIEPTAGSVKFDGIELTALPRTRLRTIRPRFQMIFQDPFSSLNERLTVERIVGEPLRVSGAGRREIAGRVRELLQLVGLNPKLADRYPHEFSGGQRQRIGVARALATEPDFVVADEPVSALDVSIQAQIVNLLADLRTRLGLTCLFIAHDLTVVRHISDEVAVMYLGRIVEWSERDELYANPRHPYTVALMSAVPVPDPVKELARERIILGGEVPSPVMPPPGCRFHTRCPLRRRLGDPEVCETVVPELTEYGPKHRVACHFAEHDVMSA